MQQLACTDMTTINMADYMEYDERHEVAIKWLMDALLIEASPAKQ